MNREAEGAERVTDGKRWYPACAKRNAADLAESSPLLPRKQVRFKNKNPAPNGLESLVKGGPGKGVALLLDLLRQQSLVNIHAGQYPPWPARTGLATEAFRE